MKKQKTATVFFLIIILMFGCTKPEKTGVIYGTVTDFATGEPIKNVNVTLHPTGTTTLTGSDGMYQFVDLDAGQYSISFSKAEYVDLKDEYVIELAAGKSISRDVQLQKKIASLQITDMTGNNLSELDFGMQESVTSKSFNIFNNGTQNISCELNYECQWITSVTSITAPIAPGQTVTINVVIDRQRLSGGENITFLHIVSNNGSNEIKVKAMGADIPTVNTANITGITANSATCGGNVIADGGTFVTDRGICWSTTNTPTIESNHVSMGQGTGTFNCNMSNLTPNTQYYVRAFASNNRGTAYGEQKTFTTSNGLPTVTTATISNILATSATSGGNVTGNGGFSVTARGICWNTTGYPDINAPHTTNGTGNGSFIANMSNLSPNTTYHVRAYATNNVGTSYGQDKTFTTNNGIPTVTTTTVTNITATTAQGGGSATANGGLQITAKGICWNTSGNPDVNGLHTTNGAGNGTFTVNMTGLALNTTYYVRAYATTSAGSTYYGSEKTFTTKDGKPEVTTTEPTKSGMTVTTGGNVTSDGGYTITARGICWGTTHNPDLSSAHNHTTNGSGTGSFSSTFVMPDQGIYYIRAYATNSNGTSYGLEKEIRDPYNDLPSFTFGGQTYRVAPAAPTTMTWSNANSYCNNLTLYGYSDWRMPTGAELSAAITNNPNDSGFYVWSWCSTRCNFEIPGIHYEVYYFGSNGWSSSCEDDNTFHYVRAVRVE